MNKCCLSVQLLRVHVLLRRGGWAAAPNPMALSPSLPSPPARRTSQYSTHASSALVNTHAAACPSCKLTKKHKWVTNDCVCVQACGQVSLHPSLAAPLLARCCWLTSTPLVPHPSSTLTSTRCKGCFSLCLPNLSNGLFLPSVLTISVLVLNVQCFCTSYSLLVPVLHPGRATWKNVWWITTLALAWMPRFHWSLTTSERSIQRNAGETCYPNPSFYWNILWLRNTCLIVLWF